MDYAKCSNVELLSIVIGTRSAKRLYQGTLAPLFAADRGACPNNLVLVAAKELVQRWLAEELERGDTLCAPDTVRSYLRLMFAGEEREVFIALFLDTQHRLIVAEKLFFGTLSQTAVYPREVVKRALQLNAASMIFAHNHPSGVFEPSMADTCLTQELKKALALVDVKVLDHFIIAGSMTMSFAERGLV